MDNLLNLEGRKGLIAGIANEHGITFGCAKAMHGAGADLLMTYGDARAEPYVQQAVERLPGVSTIDDVGAVATCLVSDAAALTGHTAYVDAGLHIRA